MWCVSRLLDRYISKTYHVLRIHHPRDGIRWGVCNTPLHWILKNQRVFGKYGRGVLHTPHKRSIYGTNDLKTWCVSIIYRIWIPKTWCVFRLYDRYILKNWRVLCIHHPLDNVRWGVCNTPLPWRSKNYRASTLLPSRKCKTRRV